MTFRFHPSYFSFYFIVIIQSLMNEWVMRRRSFGADWLCEKFVKFYFKYLQTNRQHMKCNYRYMAGNRPERDPIHGYKFGCLGWRSGVTLFGTFLMLNSCSVSGAACGVVFLQFIWMFALTLARARVVVSGASESKC